MSRLRNILLASATLLTITLGTAACSTGTTDVSSLDGTQQIQYQYEHFYQGVTEIDAEKATKVFNDLKKLPDNPTKAQQVKSLDELDSLAPEAFKALDFTGFTYKQERLTLAQLAASGLLSNSAGTKPSWKVPAEAITIKGDKAVVKSSKVEYTVSGKKTKNEQSDVAFVKKNGVWLIELTPPAATTATPTPTPTSTK